MGMSVGVCGCVDECVNVRECVRYVSVCDCESMSVCVCVVVCVSVCGCMCVSMSVCVCCSLHHMCVPNVHVLPAWFHWLSL